MAGDEIEIRPDILLITGNRDDPPDAGLPGPGEDAINFPGEARGREVSVGVC
jgi:hypothetical protein